MMDALRRGAKGFTAKILLGLLVLSFAVWGVSSAFVQRQADVVVAAGESTVDVNEFRLAYSRGLAELSQRFGTRLTVEQAEALGLTGAVTEDLVSGVVLDEQARLLELGISTDELARVVADDPALVGFDGSFDRNQARLVLRNAGLTEADYLESQADVARRRQLLAAVGASASVPEVYLSAMGTFAAQSRDVSVLRIDPSVVPEPQAPDDDALATWFEDNAARYAAPEYRSASVVALTADALADPDAVAEDDVRDVYETESERFAVAETRDVQTLVFPNREEADEAAARLADGLVTFDALIEERGAREDDITVRGARRSTFPDAALADDAFLLAEGETSDVLDGRFGPVILRATSVEEGQALSYEEVAPQIRMELAREAAERTILDVSDAIEDARAGGATLAEAVEGRGLELTTIDAVDATGLDADGQAVDTPGGADLVAALFESEVGVDERPLDEGRGGFVFYELLGVEAARNRTLDEVRERAVQDYVAAERERAASELAASLEERLRSGEAFETLAGEVGRTVQRVFDVRRNTRDGVDEAVVEAAFSGPESHVALVPMGDGEYRLVAVDRIVQVAGSGGGAAVIASDLAEDVLAQFVNELQHRYQPTFNAQAAEFARANTY